MKTFTMIAAAVLAAGTVNTAAQAAVNLLNAPGFESPSAPSATTTDQAIPGPFSPSVPVTQNPWFYGKSLTSATGSTAFYSSDIPSFVGSPPSNRINSIPTGATTPNTKANDGNQYGYAYTVGQLSGQSTYIAQGITGATVVPGDTYTASAYFFMKNNTTGTGSDGDRFQASGSFDSVQLVFLDSAGAVISSAQSPTRVDNTTAANTWTQLSFNAVAPANTASIVFENLLTRGATGGVLFVDSASLTDNTVASPEPASVGLLLCGSLLLTRRRR